MTRNYCTLQYQYSPEMRSEDRLAIFLRLTTAQRLDNSNSLTKHIKNATNNVSVQSKLNQLYSKSYTYNTEEKQLSQNNRDEL